MPPGEPEGELLTWPGARCGLAMLVAARDGQPMLTALWPFTTDGAEHEIRIDKVSLAPDRLQAVIEGTIGDTLSLAWLDVQFAVDRAYYAAGSVHQVVLAGIAHQFDVGAPPPVRIAPDAPNYQVLRQELDAEALDDDGAIVVHTDGMAAIFPLDGAPMTLHSIQGPVKRIDEYGGEMFGRKIWRLRITVARIGDGYDTDVDLDVFLTDVVLDGRLLPAVGDDVSATVRLQGRIWRPNVQRFR
ncbi:MAG TPA: hypothetical protein PKZ97_16615 [Azospirillaceae bacterium]|nr:hypothetical protein [Azospirillaceae bacterium]